MIQNDKQVKAGQDKPIHSINLVSRANMDISGVREVLSFDDAGAVISTVDGEMTVEGSGIKIGELNTKDGCVTLGGRIDAIYYSEETPERKRSGLRKLFG